jgi:hypothetical protein
MTYTTAPATMHSGHDIRDERGHMVAIVHNPKANPAEGAKIAALMAAAPDLLKTLCYMLGAAEADALDDRSNEWRSHMIDARAAIARATGAAQ